MKLTAAIDGATPIGPGIWYSRGLSSDDFSGTNSTKRPDLPSVLIIGDANFEEKTAALSFDFRSAEIMIAGAPSRGSIILQAKVGSTQHSAAPLRRAVSTMDGELGDEGYLHLLKSMNSEISGAGRDLLERVRLLDPDGALEQRGRRFINRPDNFVALEPQTTINQIIVHIRGVVPTTLRHVATQRGYTAFKVRSSADLLEAGRMLGSAKRKF